MNAENVNLLKVRGKNYSLVKNIMIKIFLSVLMS